VSSGEAVIHALERDGSSCFTFQGERLGIGAHADSDQWTQVTIYRALSDGAYVLHTWRMTRSSAGRGVRAVAVYATADLLLAALRTDVEDSHFAQAAQKGLVMALSKDPSLGRDLT
jgi:hypothetical protein